MMALDVQCLNLERGPRSKLIKKSLTEFAIPHDAPVRKWTKTHDDDLQFLPHMRAVVSVNRLCCIQTVQEQ